MEVRNRQPLPRSLSEMAWPEVADILAQTDVVLIPVGQIAQHGRHLPLNTDVIQAEEVCRRIVARLSALGSTILLGPTVPFGHSPTHYQFPGYISLRPETFTQVVYDVIASLARQQFRRFVIMNVGGGNWAGVENAAFHAHADLSVEVFLLGWFEMAPIWGPMLETHRPGLGEHDGHAGELETSCILAAAPGLVATDRLERFHSPLYQEIDLLPFANMNMNERCRAIGCWDLSRISPSGMWGDATAASAEKGNRIYDAVTDVVAQHILKYVIRSAGA
jgi:creatinine amidohydrolase